MRNHAFATAMLVAILLLILVGCERRASEKKRPENRVRSGVKAFTNSVGMDMILVTSTISRKEAGGARVRPDLRHPYYISSTEVTNGQFRAFVEATSYVGKFPDGKLTPAQKLRIVVLARKHIQLDNKNPWGGIFLKHLRDPALDKYAGDHYPVMYVSHEDATAFCRWLSDKEGRYYRLPTGDEWERACEAGAEKNQVKDVGLYAWYSKNSNSEPHPVAEKQPNGIELYDMKGNVWEWCHDFIPEDQVRQDPVYSGYKCAVIRGGCWYNSRVGCRLGSFESIGARGPGVGFRVVAAFDEPLDETVAGAKRQESGDR